MRHFLANIAIYVLAALLLGGAALFGWVRAAQLVLSDESTVIARFEPGLEHDFEWEDLGASSYVRNCANCHGGDGEGWDQYPALRVAGSLFLSPGGREYLVDVHLYGLTSERWRAPMPPMGHLNDVELAAVLNHLLTNLGNVEQLPEGVDRYLPVDVKERRGRGLDPWRVNERRPGREGQ
jgi:hypothetical protein